MGFFRNAGRSLLAAIPSSVAAAALMMAAVFGLNALLLPAPAGKLDERMRAAFTTGILPDHHVYDPDRRIGALTWNDCLILMMAMDLGRPRAEMIVSPMILTPKGTTTTDSDACKALHAVVMDGRRGDFDALPYHRYISGFAAPAAALVPALGVAGYRTLLSALNYAVILAILAVALWRWIKHGTIPFARRRRMLAGVILFGMILGFGGVEFYAQGFSIGLADPVVYALFAVLLFGRPVRMSRAKLTAITAVFFALITALEFWTGQLPLAFAGGVGLIGLDIENENDRRLALPRILDFMAAALLAVIAMFAIKIAAAEYVFHTDVVKNMRDQLGVRVGNGDFGLVKLILHLAGRADHIGQGSLVLGLANGAAGTAALFYGWWLLFASGAIDPVRRETGVALTVSVLLLTAWHLVFRNHSTIHSEFMVRSFVWWIAAGWIMLILGLESRNRLDHAGLPHSLDERSPKTNRS